MNMWLNPTWFVIAIAAALLICLIIMAIDSLLHKFKRRKKDGR